MRAEVWDVALEKVRAAVADSGAVPIVREVRRDYDPTGIAHTMHRIAANTDWARRSSAKARPLYSSATSPDQTDAATRR